MNLEKVKLFIKENHFNFGDHYIILNPDVYNEFEFDQRDEFVYRIVLSMNGWKEDYNHPFQAFVSDEPKPHSLLPPFAYKWEELPYYVQIFEWHKK